MGDKFDFEINGVKFIGLNSNFWQLDQDGLLNGNLEKLVSTKTSNDQFEYLLDNLTESNCKRTIVFCHHPIFYSTPSEFVVNQFMKPPGLYFEGFKYSIYKLLQILDGSNVSHVFCGHTHANKIVKWNCIECVQTSSLSSNQRNFGESIIGGRGIPLPVL